MSDLQGSRWQRDNGTWTVQGIPEWDPRRGRHVRPNLGTYNTEEAALTAQIEYTARVSRGMNLPNEAMLNRMTLGEYLTGWIEDLAQEEALGLIARRTFLDYESVTRIHLVPLLRSVAIGEINPPLIRRWLLQVRSSGVSERTVEKAFRTLHRALGDSALPINPVRLPKRHRPAGSPRQQPEYPDARAVRSFVAHLSECEDAKRTRAETVLITAAFTGLRRGELCGLAWSDIDLDAGTLTVAHTLQVDRDSTLFVKGPKSSYGLRTIGLPDSLATLLRTHRSTMRGERLAGGASYESQPYGRDLVFRSTPTGRPLHPNALTKLMRREWDHTGTTTRTTLHGLRHAVASQLILNGMSLTDTAAHIGDKPQTVAMFYQHELDAASRRSQVSAMIEGLYG